MSQFHTASRRFGDLTYLEIRECARQDQIANPHSREVNWNDPRLDFAQYSAAGVIGDPTHASAELGKRLWEATVEVAAQLLKTCATS